MASKVLIAEDETVLRMLMEITLEDMENRGAAILTTGNGAEALQIIRAEKPGLVFLDVMMPIMNGFDVCQAVKRDPNLSGVYIVLLTAKGEAFDRVRGEQVGTDMYLTKPFDPDELIKITGRVLAL